MTCRRERRGVSARGRAVRKWEVMNKKASLRANWGKKRGIKNNRCCVNREDPYFRTKGISRSLTPGDICIALGGVFVSKLVQSGALHILTP